MPKKKEKVHLKSNIIYTERFAEKHFIHNILQSGRDQLIAESFLLVLKGYNS